MRIPSTNSSRAISPLTSPWLAALGLAVVLVGGGCQAIVPSALGGKLALSEEARIAKQAKADSFPTPADVGLTPVDSEL